jgi:hypothetical protein
LELATGLTVSTATSHFVDPSEPAVTVVVDSIPNIARQLRMTKTGTLMFHDRPVCFMSNPNLLAELARLNDCPLAEVFDKLDGRIIHEGPTIARLGSDKVRQQALCAGTPIEPVAAIRPCSLGAAVEAARDFADQFKGCVVKPDATSGGTGVVVVDPRDSTKQIGRALSRAVKDLRHKYGDGWKATCPLAVYEFIHAKPARGLDGSKRWDMRFEVLVRPTSVTVTPLSARMAPEVVGDRLTRANVVTNQTGRAPGEAQLITPRELCRRVGMEERRLLEAAEGVYEWTRAALNSSVTP